MKPQDFLIGIRDFFAILVPGAIVLLILPLSFRDFLEPGSDLINLFAFAIIAYLIGSLADKLGAVLDYAIDPLLKSARLGAVGKRFAARSAEAQVCRDQLVSACVPAIPSFEPAKSLRSFWWDQLRLNCPAAMQELDRIEAIQKMFRSLTAAIVFLFVYEALVAAPEWRLFNGAVGHIGLWLLLAGLVSAALYTIGRFAFSAAVCRLAVAYCVHKRSPPSAG